MDTRRSWIALAGLAVFALVGLAVLAVATVGVSAGEQADEAAAKAEMETWIALGQPAQQHKFLELLEGKWKARSKMWTVPGQPPTETAGSASNAMVLGGRFLESHFESSVMGMPFKGIAFDGYDRIGEQYVGTWMDSMGTMIMTFEGTASDDGKVRTMLSEFKDPMSGKMMKMKSIVKILSKDEHVWEAWEQKEDGEFRKTMEITYSRM